MDVLLVIDMQQGLLRGAPKHDLNRLAERVRARGGSVPFVQHAGPVGDDFEPRTPGWQLLTAIKRKPGDRVVEKTLNDPFFKTLCRQSWRTCAPPVFWWRGGRPTCASMRRSVRRQRSAST